MKANKQFPILRDHRLEMDSAGIIKFIYLVMFLLIGSSSVIGIAGIHQPLVRGVAIPPADSISASEEGAAPRVLMFHLGESGSGLCENLTVTTAGNAFYSSCDTSTERQYILSSMENAQLQNWVKQFQAVDFDRSSKTGTGNKTVQLYLNGQGSRQASDAETQQLVDFATTLAAKIASQS
jgi:hypothetical protein